MVNLKKKQQTGAPGSAWGINRPAEMWSILFVESIWANNIEITLPGIGGTGGTGPGTLKNLLSAEKELKLPRKTKGIKAEKKANYGGGGGESAGTAIAGATHGPGPQAPYLQRGLQNIHAIHSISGTFG